MKLDCRNPSSCQTGFTLVEIMVGLAIGLLATIVIVQVMSVFENQKRVTTGTSDAQVNGSIALYDITRELQPAGFSIMPVSASSTPFDCTIIIPPPVGAAKDIKNLSPVTIVDGGLVSDTITIRYGNSTLGGVPSIIKTAPLGKDVTLASSFGCKKDDITLVTNGNTCVLSTVDIVQNTTTITLKDDPTPAATTGASLACLGGWVETTFGVLGDNLTKADFNQAPISIVAGIVNLQAQYGIAQAGLSVSDTKFNQIDKWVDATGVWANPSVANRNMIKAVRIAVVARNAKRDTQVVTNACSSFVGLSPSGLCAWEGTADSPAPSIDLTANGDWQRYRYRVFETIIPIRNIIWSKESIGS